MFNHARTLLMNVKGSSSPGEDFFGEELVPVDYKKLELPTYLDVVRSRLFGADPDRAMLNYRVKQLLNLVQSTELNEYVLALDPRVTYDLADEHDLVLRETFRPASRQVAGSPAALYVLGTQTAPDPVGRLRFQYDVDVLLSDSIEIKRVTPYPRSWIFAHSLSNGLSPAYELPSTGYRVAVNTNNPGTRFIVEGFLRPEWSMGQIVNMLQSMGETVLVQLLGIDATEPYQTFRTLWYDHPELPYRLSAIVLAIVYRMEELRRNG